MRQSFSSVLECGAVVDAHSVDTSRHSGDAAKSKVIATGLPDSSLNTDPC